MMASQDLTHGVAVLIEKQEVEVFEALKAIVRRAVMTLITLKDPERKYRIPQSAWLFPVIQDSNEAYGYTKYSFDPTPHDISQMETVAGWLAWLRRTEGDIALKRIIAWTLGVPTWRLGTRERCSERTIRNRIDRSIAAIVSKFASVDITVEIVEDSKLPTPYSMILEAPPGPHGDEVMLKKVYIHDQGFFMGSKRWRDGREKADKYLKHLY